MMYQPLEHATALQWYQAALRQIAAWPPLSTEQQRAAWWPLYWTFLPFLPELRYEP